MIRVLVLEWFAGIDVLQHAIIMSVRADQVDPCRPEQPDKRPDQPDPKNAHKEVAA